MHPGAVRAKAHLKRVSVPRTKVRGYSLTCAILQKRCVMKRLPFRYGISVLLFLITLWFKCFSSANLHFGFLNVEGSIQSRGNRAFVIAS